MSEAVDHTFVQVNLDREFLAMQMSRLHELLEERLKEPRDYADALSEPENCMN